MPSLSIKITKSKKAENASEKLNEELINANNTFSPSNFPAPDLPQFAQIPPSFTIHKDDSHTPLAQPTPPANSISFGGLDDKLQPIDLLKELEYLPKKSARKWVKF